MSRYFAELAFNGAAYCGWQKQPNGPSVQAKVEAALSTLLRHSVGTTGCGRTDAGVHASQFFLHFDTPDALPEDLTPRLNSLLPPDIAIYRIFPVADHAHARFDAVSRSYTYHIALRKDPFVQRMAYYYPLAAGFSLERLRAAAEVLYGYEAFFPFCKTHGAAKTMQCRIMALDWEHDAAHGRLLFHITADRFLRGMVRLIVGMCLHVAAGKIDLEEVRGALDEQRILSKSNSVPSDGLFLTDVRYGEDLSFPI